MYLFIGIIESEYTETEWISTVAENIEQAREKIIEQLMIMNEREKEYIEKNFTIKQLWQLNGVYNYNITLTKI